MQKRQRQNKVERRSSCATHGKLWDFADFLREITATRIWGCLWLLNVVKQTECMWCVSVSAMPNSPYNKWTQWTCAWSVHTRCLRERERENCWHRGRETETKKVTGVVKKTRNNLVETLNIYGKSFIEDKIVSQEERPAGCMRRNVRESQKSLEIISQGP